MKIVKVAWMNDERKDMVVRVMDVRYDPVTATGDLFVTLKPYELREFEVHMLDDSILYVKKWPEMVMISYLEQTSLQPDAQLHKQPQGEGVS